ncbi:hypothetical protein CWO17_11495 [Vibrio sp. 10N.286.45.A3]|uniref:hypothetical protein n=1 Tax=unclassified Vibrio TaxID=2614977 RepID=UPI000D38F8C8|nr:MULTISPECIES: hypothetical protein [unclassified Vibrio]CAK1964477.1 conserved hypothetical protein [Vibrio crassostreae]PTP05040.1 hypothetical protein CWO17_11495 [Vibrio sp. 10N.286.45.A3]TKE74696.1 hypothetical protein FCV56_23535 [Vibrio sp. F12]TKE96209.1 hypothetical protein FCV61_16245 [Vibrio sp. F12]CAK1973104.1 conserved hypothetical protein [Vibrio crassostreae]
MQINSPKDNPFSEVDAVGVALAQYPGEQNHIAILFHGEDGVMLMHVGEHKGELIEQPSDKYIWLDLGDDFHSFRKQVILAHLLHIAEENKDSQIRYGLDHAVYCLDPETGKLNDQYDSTIGFTCATFVVEVFLSCGVQLIDWDTWPAADEVHTSFQKKVFNYLHHLHQQNPDVVTLEFLKAQIGNIGKSRFLPQEIAASTQSSEPSIKAEVDMSAPSIHSQLCDYTTQYYQNRA